MSGRLLGISLLGICLSPRFIRKVLEATATYFVAEPNHININRLWLLSRLLLHRHSASQTEVSRRQVSPCITLVPVFEEFPGEMFTNKEIKIKTSADHGGRRRGCPDLGCCDRKW